MQGKVPYRTCRRYGMQTSDLWCLLPGLLHGLQYVKVIIHVCFLVSETDPINTLLHYLKYWVDDNAASWCSLGIGDKLLIQFTSRKSFVNIPYFPMFYDAEINSAWRNSSNFHSMKIIFMFLEGWPSVIFINRQYRLHYFYISYECNTSNE